MSEKIFLKLKLDLIVAEIRGVFGSVGVYACVRVWIEIVAATVFCSAKAQFWMISEAILIPKIYARLQEKLTHVGFWAHVKIASRIVSYRT